jgi:hypothetical protein
MRAKFFSFSAFCIAKGEQIFGVGQALLIGEEFFVRQDGKLF